MQWIRDISFKTKLNCDILIEQEVMHGVSIGMIVSCFAEASPDGSVFHPGAPPCEVLEITLPLFTDRLQVL